jgi:2-dehydro-3-deoxygalactonokinase
MNLIKPHPLFNPMRDHCYIAIHWNDSKIKAYLCCIQPDQSVQIVDETRAPGLDKDTQDYARTFRDLTSAWRTSHGLLPVLMAGQIGSSKGWKHTPYVSCPATTADIVNAQYQFESDEQIINIIPGLKCQHKSGHFDVIRGEEVQVLGWLETSASHRNGSYLICLPGARTKWILVSDGIIKNFKTALTGELYELLSNSGSLIQTRSTQFTPSAFDAGAKFTLASASGSLIHGLFSVHTKQLFDEVSASDASSYLSGLLIGSDVRAAIYAQEWNINEIQELIIIGESHISDLFERVIRMQTDKVRCFHGKQATVQGFAAIRQRLLALQES